MIKIKPQNPKGVRDYLPLENIQREYIIGILRRHFENYGYASIYTPAFERLETLQGKYGDEGDKLLFKILNSGEYFDEEASRALESDNINYGELTKAISSKGLRYDHTVPLARFVSQHQNEISFPFKRYTIGPVWRADRPQKGRYQEFFQCDVDVVGSKGLISDVEMIALIDRIFHDLDLKVSIKINNRKIYNGICEHIGIEANQIPITSTILDKWDKIGEEKVLEELKNNLGEEKAKSLLLILNSNSIDDLLHNFSIHDSAFIEGIEEIKYIFHHAKSSSLQLDLKLLRGLDYYTGTVLETVSTEMAYGSICGGGRYDNLTEIFGLRDMSGIGISFGLDRVYDVMKELNRFPNEIQQIKILILNLTEKGIERYFDVATNLRSKHLAVDIYPSAVKMDKQLIYADKSSYSHAIFIGEQELELNQITIKNLKTREQSTTTLDEMFSMF